MNGKENGMFDKASIFVTWMAVAAALVLAGEVIGKAF